MDGSEIHEATLTLYAIAKNGADYTIFAPDIEQHHVTDHLTGKETGEKRNVLVESARIARGNIRDMSEFSADRHDALVFPGGFGVAKNLSSYAIDGQKLTIVPSVGKAIQDMINMKKPIGALCIAPVLLAKTLSNVELTIGQDPDTIKDLEALGAIHRNTGHGQVIVDKTYKVVTTPCYMLDANIAQVGEGAENLVKAMLELM